MIYAILDNTTGLSGTVKNVAMGNSPLNDGWIDVTDLTPRPEKHWTYDGAVFNFGETPAIDYGTKLSKRAFMQRFTQPERTAIRTSTDDIVIDIYEDLQAINNVELTMQDTINAIAYLTGIGILAAGRDTEILDTPVAEDEL